MKNTHNDPDCPFCEQKSFTRQAKDIALKMRAIWDDDAPIIEDALSLAYQEGRRDGIEESAYVCEVLHHEQSELGCDYEYPPSMLNEIKDRILQLKGAEE